MRPCLELNCPELVERGRCPAHTQERNAAKEEQPHRFVYRDARWRRCRRRALIRAGFRCQVIDNGVRCPVVEAPGSALHGHHDYPGGVRALLEAGGDPFDDAIVVMACDHHHGAIEAALRASAATPRGGRRR